MKHSYSWKKHHTWIKAIKKRQVAKNIFPFYNNCPELDNLHKYSKNKFHCIWTYSPKTKQNGIYNYSVKDRRKIQSLLDSKNDYLLD